MASKTYLRIQPHKDEWVDNPKDATADYIEATEVTQVRLKTMGVLSTTLVEVPDPHQMQSKYIICREE